MTSQTVNIRVNKRTKDEAQAIFKKLGISFSSAISIYLEQVVLRNGIPFAVDLNGGSGSTPESKESKKNKPIKKTTKKSTNQSVDKAFSELFK
ncbi:MAG: type II toxin-antitoxin system RelB/DinJ family antitoxin [Bacilli bacterium]|nr:type II toxin-antitoxin system RelB/DinJ family antitoxin [Bacilli bacterium]